MIDERLENNNVSEFLAECEYESKSGNVLDGFKIFQKRYVWKSTALQLILLVIAGVIQAVNIVTNGFGTANIVILMIMFGAAIFILQKPRLTYNKLAESIATLDGIIYKAELFTDKIIITTVYDPELDKDSEKGDNENTEITGKKEASDNTEEELPPATIIHLDQGVVDVIVNEKLIVIYIKGNNIYVIPRDCFKENADVAAIERYKDILGTHLILNF